MIASLSLVPFGAAVAAIEDGAVENGGPHRASPLVDAVTTKRRKKTLQNSFLPFLLFMLGLYGCPTSVAGTQYSHNRQMLSFQSRSRETQTKITAEEPTTYLQWQEEDEDDSDETVWKSQQQQQQQQEALQTLQKTKRRLFWAGRMEDQSYQPGATTTTTKRKSSTVHPSSPHPLRMKEWKMKFSWKEQRRQRATTMEFEFDANGYVRCLHPNTVHKNKQKDDTSSRQPAGRQKKQQHKEGDELDGTNFIVGTWKVAPSGMTWNMSWDGRSYSFYADLQVNPFGEYPKMFRGLVIRDRSSLRSRGVLPRRFLRPIVATFSGRGVGIDTADLTYKGRGPPKQ